MSARPRAWAAGLASVLAYAAVPVVTAYGFAAGAEPAVLATLRGVFAVAAIAAVCALTGRLRRIPVRALAALVLCCGPVYGLQVLTYFIAIQRGGVQLPIVVVHLYPLFVIGLVSLRNRAPVSWRLTGLALVVLAGLVMVTVTGDAGAPLDAVGFALLTAAGYALYLVASERWLPQVGTVLLTGLVMFGATVTLAVCALVRGERFAVSAPAWGSAALQGLVLLPVAVGCLLFAVRGLGSVPVSILGMVEPLISVGLAALLLHERLTPLQFAGGIVILAGCALLPWVNHRERAGRRASQSL
ncbi:DMT family transporter [uncultured Mycolicibacterium sp.]|uniref:DMT family transporter n=1 Tax=uncultured Mycolicibacterium sp. TaxID=2320817 RepID=UPI00261D0224|nr:DMT family transporter [uncultured Mycolicibacterium sp.]